jgi:hypothetical protein
MPSHGVDRGGAGGGSGTVTNPVDGNVIDAKGDLIVGTAADTAARLAVGTNTYLLSALSSEDTGLVWLSPADVFQDAVDAATAETAPATGDIILLSDVSLTPDNTRKMTLANMFSVIGSLTAETTIATDDKIALYDTSGSATDSMTIENLFKVINAFTADSTPDATADYVVTYDASASGPKKVLVGDLGKWEEISRTTVSAVATVDITLPTGYKRFCLEIINVMPATDSVDAWLRFSDDSGSTFEADASDYGWNVNNTRSSTVDGTATATNIALNGTAIATIGGLAAEGIPGLTVFIDEADSASRKTTVNWIGSYWASDGILGQLVGCGWMNTASSDEAVRFMFSSGNVTSGTFILHGMK